MKKQWFSKLVPAIIAAILSACGGPSGEPNPDPGGTTTGILQVTVSGLPAGIEAAVRVSGPDDFSRNITASSSLTELEPGEYQVSAQTITAGPGSWQATGSGTIEVRAGETSSATVVYSLTDTVTDTGSMLVTITAPERVTPLVTVTGPAGFEQILSVTTELSNLDPGIYEVAAPEMVNRAGATFRPEGPADQQVEVTAGASFTATITYSEVLGSLELQISGLPLAASASIAITGPNDYSQVIDSSSGTVLFEELSTGEYQVIPGEVRLPDFEWYRTGDPLTVTVSPEERVRVPYTYAAVTPKVIVFIDRLDRGFDTANVSDWILPGLEGNGYDVEYHPGPAMDNFSQAIIRGRVVNDLIDTGAYDLVIWANRHSYGFDYTRPGTDTVRNLLAAGGRILFLDPRIIEADPDFVAGDELFELLAARPQTGDSHRNNPAGTLQRADLNTADGAHLTFGRALQNYTFSMALEVLEGGESVCNLGTTIGWSCGVVANGGRSMYLSIAVDAIQDPGIAREFYGKAVHYLLDN